MSVVIFFPLVTRENKIIKLWPPTSHLDILKLTFFNVLGLIFLYYRNHLTTTKTLPKLGFLILKYKICNHLKQYRNIFKVE